jgi:hydroxymethylglutaryl-CoA lyase
MQGIHRFIETEEKARYINSLLKVGFDVIDFGSFVSPKAIPQMRDTKELVDKLDMSQSQSKLLSIILNKRGAEDACQFEQITYLGFPFSISETFQMRNGNSTIEESVNRVEDIQNLCIKHDKKLLIYISMAFGNPYGDEWNSDIALKWTEKLASKGVEYFALADTIGASNPENISYMFSQLIPEFPSLTIGAHLHSTVDAWKEKIDAAYKSGCRNFDSAIKGLGGCPMAKDDLVGNVATENVLAYLNDNGIVHNINEAFFNEALTASNRVFL